MNRLPIPRDLPVVFGAAVLVAMLTVYFLVHPRGLSPIVIESLANSGASLAFAAIAQTFPILTGGLDLSIGGIVALTNVVAAAVVNGSPIEVAIGVALVILTGLACGLLNGLVIVYGRLQPIIATLATGTVFSGIALLLRPVPGGDVSLALADALTLPLAGLVPPSLLLVGLTAFAVWYPLRRSKLGRGMFAAGSAPEAGRLSGLNVPRSIITAYALSGLFGALAGLFLSFQTLAGDATIGLPYTINSIAAVVVGGLSLRGGSGTVLSAIFGAYTLRAINSVLLFSGAPPLAQPFFEGLILVAAVAFASIGMLRSSDRLAGMR